MLKERLKNAKQNEGYIYGRASRRVGIKKKRKERSRINQEEKSICLNWSEFLRDRTQANEEAVKVENKGIISKKDWWLKSLKNSFIPITLCTQIAIVVYLDR